MTYGADENRAGRTDPARHTARVDGLDLQVLGGVGVDRAHAGVEVVDEHDRRLLARQRRGHPLAVHGGLELVGEFAVGGVGQFRARR